MAIIKCPECGQYVSDNAPKCLSCGVKIAGKVIKCKQCGKYYFKIIEKCPKCQCKTPIVQIEATNTIEKSRNKLDYYKKREKHTIISIILTTIIICALSYYSTKIQSENTTEKNEYIYALSSDDTIILKRYLLMYPDASEVHRRMIQKRLNQLVRTYIAWQNAIISDSKTLLQEFIDRYPDSPYETQATHIIDSIDWNTAKEQNTIEAYKTYLHNQPNGDYFDLATNAIRTINTKTVQPEEEIMISNLFRLFFQSINNRDEENLTCTINPTMTSFLDKTDATIADVITFMNKIYKHNVEKMDWRVNSDYNISKKEIGDKKYEYSVGFRAIQDVEDLKLNTIKQNFKIKAKVNPDGKITEFNMDRIIE